MHPRAEQVDPGRMVTRTLREYRQGAHLSLSVILRTTGECIGRVGLRELDWTWRKVGSLSYWIDPGHWGRGFATEASWALCRAAFGPLRMHRVASQALDRNRRSLAVLRRLGFVEEGRERESVCVDGRWMDMVLFGLLRSELRPFPAPPPERSRGPARPRGAKRPRGVARPLRRAPRARAPGAGRAPAGPP
jgi:RimJ/RimL family protein N-acetyltransferase